VLGELVQTTDGKWITRPPRAEVIDSTNDACGHRVDAVTEPTQIGHFVAGELGLQAGLFAQIGGESLSIPGVLQPFGFRAGRIDLMQPPEQAVHHRHSLGDEVFTPVGSTLPTVQGCAELTAAKLIAETANVDRFPNDSAFAKYGGFAPIPQWSGSTAGRLRASRSGNRQINYRHPPHRRGPTAP
jgi:Transposase IS116/IS110/IS902 family